jgi:hypothetical protein
MPCVQAESRREREVYIQQNRQDVNEFEGIIDPVESLKIIHRPRDHDPLVNWLPHPTSTDHLYLGLSEEQQLRLANYAESLVADKRNEEAESIVLCLAAFTDVSLEKCLRAFVSHGLFWPSLPFHRASPDLRDQLIARVEWDVRNRNHILTALAWIGDDAVVDLFTRWRKRPPTWSGSLYIPPENYSREAGWELNETGQRRDLYFQRCFGLIGEPSVSSATFSAITDSQGLCPWCGKELTNLFDFTPAAFGMKSIFAPNDRMQVTTCEACTAFGTVFGDYDETGSGRWSPMNSRPEYLPDDSSTWDKLPRDPLSVADARPALFAADQFLPTTFSQIGGHPTWVQDAAYPRCPKCSKTMMFLAQVDHDDIEDCAEGIYTAAHQDL